MLKSLSAPYFTPALRRIELVAWIVMTASLMYTAVSLLDLPETVPIHFDLKGQPDSWGSPATYLLLPVVIILTCGLMSFLVHFVDPQYWNSPDKLTPETAPRWYRASICAVVATELEIAAFTLLLQILLVNQTMNLASLLAIALMITLLATYALCIYWGTRTQNETKGHS